MDPFTASVAFTLSSTTYGIMSAHAKGKAAMEDARRRAALHRENAFKMQQRLKYEGAQAVDGGEVVGAASGRQMDSASMTMALSTMARHNMEDQQEAIYQGELRAIEEMLVGERAQDVAQAEMVGHLINAGLSIYKESDLYKAGPDTGGMGKATEDATQKTKDNLSGAIGELAALGGAGAAGGFGEKSASGTAIYGGGRRDSGSASPRDTLAKLLGGGGRSYGQGSTPSRSVFSGRRGRVGAPKVRPVRRRSFGGNAPLYQ